MGRPLLIVALEFRIAGLLLGIPGVVAFVVVIRDVLLLRKAPPPGNSAPLDIGTYGLVGLLTNAARGIGPALHALSRMATWLLTLLAGGLLVVVLFAVLLYLTGNGLDQQAVWARITALALSASLAVGSCTLIARLRRKLALLAALPLGLSLYTLWVLIWRFA